MTTALAATTVPAPWRHRWYSSLVVLASYLAQSLLGRRGRVRQLAVIIVLLLIALRLALPYALAALINHRLQQPGTIHGHVGGVSLGICRGVYDLDRVHLTASEAGSGEQHPLLDIDSLRTVIDLMPLLSGQFRGSIAVTGIVLHLGPPAKTVVTKVATPTVDEDWRTIIAEMVHVRISSIRVAGGQVAYDDPGRDVHAGLSTIDGEVRDLIVPAGSDRPAYFTFSGLTPGRGTLLVSGTAVVGADNPHAVVEASIVDMALPDLSPISKHYDGLVFQTGMFDGYLKLALDGTHLTGTFKPIMHHLSVTSLEKDTGPVATRLYWKLVVPLAQYILENPDQDQQAAIVPIDGEIDDPHTDLWTIIGTALRNAFIHALIPGFDGLQPAKQTAR
jgi:hypothetical protein